MNIKVGVALRGGFGHLHHVGAESGGHKLRPLARKQTPY
jgi:hypothetical protein